ncbi:hypothetical protein G3I60_22385 [Streptomyces sp. SID13666]|uniref:hypothetical protein n=1 Tax=unclassified Streptomyces TaxID=2593676 RepID=UPI0013C1D332|nr:MULTISPECIES: hypothetical protein [unclassified Streptomyces]NEA56810.1 hypothetical protein [Streptomyces sp. SID13666]NEA72634.1 hypothetical protein [Streptomyces sp. SID13588]
MIHPLRATAAAVITTAAAVVFLTGCSSSDPKAAAPPTASAPASGGLDQNPTATAAPTTPGPTVPAAELTPATGSFTKQQKQYLTGRVPKGSDPAAVLELGQESCDKIKFIAKRDPDAAASGIVLGQISSAHDAVTALCPDQKPVLAAAEHGFTDGTFTVGSKVKAGSVITPGTYHAPTPSKGCSWKLTGADGKAVSGSRALVTVPAGARGFTSTGCSVWLFSKGE